MSDTASKMSVTCTAPVNIAVVKYWGKRDEKLILPTNSSLSVTLHQEQLCAKTTVATSRDFTKDRMWLNGVEESLDTPRLQNVLRENIPKREVNGCLQTTPLVEFRDYIKTCLERPHVRAVTNDRWSLVTVRRRAHKRKHSDQDENSTNPLLNCHVHICSENNFPTAAGLASSAAGYACLVFALARLFKVEGDISEIARQGSGSACRSVYGGFVEWTQGERNDGVDSLAHQVASESHWSDLHVLVLVVSSKKKHIGSTAGMQTSVQTSDLFQHRVQHVVPQRMKLMKQAIEDKDFQMFAELTIKDSNQMHAVCLDTYPPISYMTDTSREVTRLVHAVNKYYGENKVAYTFDAGPNACLYLLKKDVPMMTGLIQHFFPPSSDCDEFVQGISAEIDDLPENVINAVPLQPSIGSIQYMIHTKVGPGPQVLNNDNASLLDINGLPKKTVS